MIPVVFGGYFAFYGVFDFKNMNVILKLTKKSLKSA